MSIMMTKKINLFVDQMNLTSGKSNLISSISDFFSEGKAEAGKYVVAKNDQVMYYLENKLHDVARIVVAPHQNHILKFNGNVIETSYYEAFAGDKKKGKGSGSTGGTSSNNNNNNNNNNG